MSRRKLIYEGKAKILYEGPERNTIVQYFKDDATAFNNEKKAIIEGKGVLNNRISEFIYNQLNDWFTLLGRMKENFRARFACRGVFYMDCPAYTRTK